jgi:hypothetical protein
MMKFFKKIFSSGGPQERYFIYHVKCKRCGEVIEGRIDTTNDLSIEYEDKREVYHVRKVLIGDGSNHCYQQIEVEIQFNGNRDVLEKTITNGEFVEE